LSGTTITVIANPDPGSAFGEWSGQCDSVSESKCVVMLDAPKTITVTFTVAKYALSVSKSGSGSGSVTSLPTGIDCGSTCSHEYDHGTVVSLSEAPGSISEFTGWSGCDEVVAGTCKVAMTKARSVTVTFITKTHELGIDKVGPGSGSVSCDGGACASSYPEGTTVSLSATADPSSSFVGWAGGGCSGAGGCTVTLDSDITVTASFEVNPAPVSSVGSGTLVVVPSKALVRGVLAAIPVSCKGGPCKGVLKLFARLPSITGQRSGRRDKKSATVLIGKSSFNLASEASETLVVTIANRRALGLLRRGRTLQAQVRGAGVRQHLVKLRRAGKEGAA
jgi:hypothetical protein